MPSISNQTVRISEWAKVSAHGLSPGQRQQLNAAAGAWAQQQSLPAPPLSFSGPDGQWLCANQYVGVIEVDDVAVEIYPKLDAALISNGDSAPIADTVKLNTVMRNLLWMLEVSAHRELIEADTGHLEETPTNFFDLFAYLLGKNLLSQLMSGVPHRYVAHRGDLHTVRGKINLGEQVSRNWNRFDRIACTWDEFTPNTPVNRLLKCACRFLAGRVSYSEAARLLIDCLALLDEVEDVSPLTALRDVQNLRFDRSMDRFRLAYDLAQRLLRSSGHALGVGGANTYVFLIDMNKLFEDYVHAALAAHFRTAISQQETVGYLFPGLKKGRIQQNADYFWRHDDGLWIGDAKYKHLTKGQTSALKFAELPDPEDGPVSETTLAGQVLSAADARQLTVYSELAKGKYQPEDNQVSLMLLYPFVGADLECVPDRATAWNGADFWLVPVRVDRPENAASIIPDFPLMP
jgi:5-methylcytosine-specific restriction endonuclease McrBC regulatory subunit McrC